MQTNVDFSLIQSHCEIQTHRLTTNYMNDIKTYLSFDLILICNELRENLPQNEDKTCNRYSHIP